MIIQAISSRTCKSLALIICAMLISFSALDATAAAVSTESLIDEMLSMETMAEFPTPSYTCKQFSSYEPASKSPSQDWFANGDAGHFIRIEETANGKEHVMMDTAGPGAIVRIWSANPAGKLRIYIDHKPTPEIAAEMSDLLGGKFPGLPRPIAGEYSRGWNLYFPIPYAKHCKVTSDKGGFYYHVNYRTYEKGTQVEPFRQGLLEQRGRLVGKVAALAATLSNPSESAPSGRTEPFEAAIAPGESEVVEFTGPAAIARAVARVKASSTETALRGLILLATFDDENCVEVPIGDFFGSAPGINAFETLPLGMSREGAVFSRWFMPFKRSAVLKLWNTTTEPVTVSGELIVAPYKWTEKSMHFRANWRAEFDVPTRPMQDWNYITAEGRGVFAGASFAIDNPVRQWWGEGDEKIYVDGESFPSHFGTGTEDYYGYAWCWPGLFTHAYHSQSRCDGPGNHGRTSVNRFHIIDRIPFNTSFKFDMELWHWHESTKVNMAVTTYWYGRPGAKAANQPVTSEIAVVRPIEPYVAPRVKGAIEGEDMTIAKVSGVAAPQDWGGLSGEKHLWWHKGFGPGDTLAVHFPAPDPGTYRVYARFLTAKDYGIHQLSINGTKAGEPMDFYSPKIAATKEKDLGVFLLDKEANTFQATVIGANPKAIKSYMLGLDYLRLEKQ